MFSRTNFLLFLQRCIGSDNHDEIKACTGLQACTLHAAHRKLMRRQGSHIYSYMCADKEHHSFFPRKSFSSTRKTEACGTQWTQVYGDVSMHRACMTMDLLVVEGKGPEKPCRPVPLKYFLQEQPTRTCAIFLLHRHIHVQSIVMSTYRAPP